MPKIDPIIIVEDDPDDQFLLKKILERLNSPYELIFFKNGTEALKFLKETDLNPFLILCDINMPLMNGLEFRKAIHEDVELRRKSIPFVFLTTSASKPEVDEAYKLTVQGFFQKEVRIEKYENMLRTILEYWGQCKHPDTVI